MTTSHPARRSAACRRSGRRGGKLLPIRQVVPYAGTSSRCQNSREKDLSRKKPSSPHAAFFPRHSAHGRLPFQKRAFAEVVSMTLKLAVGRGAANGSACGRGAPRGSVSSAPSPDGGPRPHACTRPRRRRAQRGLERFSARPRPARGPRGSGNDRPALRAAQTEPAREPRALAAPPSLRGRGGPAPAGRSAHAAAARHATSSSASGPR